MKPWPYLAVGGAGALVLLAVLASRSEPDPRTDNRTPDVAPAKRVDPVVPPKTRGPSPADGEPDDDRKKPVPGTERWHYEEFLRRAAAEPGAFDRLVEQKNTAEAPLQERVALLRAAWKVKDEDALRWFADAFAETAGKTDRTADALRGFVVRHLAAHGRRDAKVRTFLTDEVFADKTVGARDRSLAGRAVARAAPPAEIATLLALLKKVPDAAAAEGALVGLGQNEHAEAAAALDALARQHPQKRVRDRAAEVARQRRAGRVETEEDD